MGLMVGVNLSLGSVKACCQATSEAMASTHADLHAQVKAADSVHADETGFGRCGGNSHVALGRDLGPYGSVPPAARPG